MQRLPSTGYINNVVSKFRALGSIRNGIVYVTCLSRTVPNTLRIIGHLSRHDLRWQCKYARIPIMRMYVYITTALHSARSAHVPPTSRSSLVRTYVHTRISAARPGLAALVLVTHHSSFPPWTHAPAHANGPPYRVRFHMGSFYTYIHHNVIGDLYNLCRL